MCPTLSIIDVIYNPTCFEACDWSIIITDVTNGVAPLSYLWNSGSSESFDFNLCEGDYIVTITDSNECTIIDTFYITQPDEIIITIVEIINITINVPGAVSVSTNNTGSYI